MREGLFPRNCAVVIRPALMSPELRARIEVARAEVRRRFPELQRQRDALEACSKITAADLAIIVRAT